MPRDLFTNEDAIDSFRNEYRFLSNFVPVEVEFEGVIYPSVEHAYVAAKTTDSRVREQVLLCSTAGQVKRLGRTFELRSDWDEIKLIVMEDLLQQKFKQQPFRKLLFDTGVRELIEGNTWGDTFWGVCNGKGQNHLGRLLMKIRGELK